MSFCQYNRKLSSILSFFGSSQRVARGGVKRPCKRERAFFLRKTCSQNGQSKKRQIEQLTVRTPLVLPVLPASLVLPVPLVLLALPASLVLLVLLVLHTTHPTYTHYLRSPVHRVSRAQLPAMCLVCPLPTARHGKHEIRGKTAWGSKMSASIGRFTASNNRNYV